MKRCDRGQADQDKVSDDCYHITSALRTLHYESYVIIFNIQINIL